MDIPVSLSKTCPLAPLLRERFWRDILTAMDSYDIGPSMALCNVVCPSVLGRSENLSDGRCAIRSRLLKEVPLSQSPSSDPRDRLFVRLEALRDGSAATDRLIDTVKDILDRYIFLAAYVSANRDSSEFSALLVKTMEDEDAWPSDTDPDVLAMFEILRAEELDYRRQREE